MVKKSFTTRIDAEILALAQELAAKEHRSVTNLIEVALREYAKRYPLGDVLKETDK
jgi:hypothetical protein